MTDNPSLKMALDAIRAEEREKTIREVVEALRAVHPDASHRHHSKRHPWIAAADHIERDFGAPKEGQAHG